MKHHISGNWGQHVQVQASEVAKARMIWAPDLLLLTDRWINPQRFSLNSWRNGPILTNLHFAARRLLSCCVFVCTSCMQGNILLRSITAWRQCVCKALWLPGTRGSAFPCFPCFLLFFFSEFCLHISLFGPTLLSQVSLRDNQLPICFLTHKNNQRFTSVTDFVEKHMFS